MQYYYAIKEFSGRLIGQDTNRVVAEQMVAREPDGRVLNSEQYAAMCRANDLVDPLDQDPEF